MKLSKSIDQLMEGSTQLVKKYELIPNSMPIIYNKLTFSIKEKHISDAMECLEENVKRYGRELTDNEKVCLSEAILNACTHSSENPENNEKTVRVEWWQTMKYDIYAVESKGNIDVNIVNEKIARNKTVLESSSPADIPTSGRGFYIMTELMDGVFIKNTKDYAYTIFVRMR